MSSSSLSGPADVESCIIAGSISSGDSEMSRGSSSANVSSRSRAGADSLLRLHGRRIRGMGSLSGTIRACFFRKLLPMLTELVFFVGHVMIPRVQCRFRVDDVLYRGRGEF